MKKFSIRITPGLFEIESFNDTDQNKPGFWDFMMRALESHLK